MSLWTRFYRWLFGAPAKPAHQSGQPSAQATGQPNRQRSTSAPGEASVANAKTQRSQGQTKAKSRSAKLAWQRTARSSALCQIVVAENPKLAAKLISEWLKQPQTPAHNQRQANTNSRGKK